MKAKRDVAAEVTARIVEALEAGVAPWAKPWKGDAGFSTGFSWPKNAASGRSYNGVNVILLGMAGYADPRWLTFKQAKEMGGSVKKGEKGTQIAFWNFVEKEQKDGKIKKIPFLRTFTVFNVEQCEGLDEAKLKAEAPKEKSEAENPGTVADEIAERVGATVRRMGERAGYSPSRDMIVMPACEAFESETAYAATLLHELVHWTGHESRLNRSFGKRFGDAAYAAEELVAELGAAFLAASLGLEGKLQHAEYLGHWVEMLKGDKTAIFTAAKEAQKAMEHLLGATEEAEKAA